MSLNRIPYPTGNYSTRGGAAVRLIVLHTAEGARNIADLGAWFANPASGVSSHVGIDDTANTVGEYVRRDYKAWTAANANPVAVQAELCAFADWDAAEWNRHGNMLANTAAWIAEEAKAFGIPIVKLAPAAAQSNGRGVCQHNDLGSWGGGHWDCGPAFPIDAVIALAQGVTPTPSPPAAEEEIEMFVASATSDSTHDPNIKKGYTYVVLGGGKVSSIATTADFNALVAKLGPAVSISGNQIWGLGRG